MYKILPALLFFLPAGAAAQAPAPMADGLRADGKIWVVVVVLATIFAGIVIALIRTDRRIARLERDRGVNIKD